MKQSLKSTPAYGKYMNTWTPVLHGDLSDRAWTAVDDIADCIFSGDYPEVNVHGRRHRGYENPLLYAYLSLGKHNSLWADRAVERLNSEIERAPLLGQQFGLFGGLCGLAWVVEHVSDLLGEDAAEGPPDTDPVADVDLAVLQTLKRAPWSGPYDLVSGLVGFGAYFLERLPRQSAISGIAEIIDRIEAQSQVTEEGITWHSSPELLPDWQRKVCPQGYFNMGVAHGIPGILYFLNEVARRELDQRAWGLLDNGMNWFMRRRRPEGSLSWFSGWVAEGQNSDSRLTWCYGDLGILSIFIQISLTWDNPKWKDFAARLLDHCLAWPPHLAGVNDAPLCHGSVGIAHCFNRIYHTVGDERCRDTAVSWFERTLAMREPGAGVGGYKAYTRPDLDGPVVWESSAAFLDGSMGIALALLSGLTPLEPQWDRMLLLSAPEASVKSPETAPRTVA